MDFEELATGFLPLLWNGETVWCHSLMALSLDDVIIVIDNEGRFHEAPCKDVRLHSRLIRVLNAAMDEDRGF